MIKRQKNLVSKAVTNRSGNRRRFELQKAIIDKFLPRFGHGAKVVYAGLEGRRCRYIDPVLSDRLALAIDSSCGLPVVIAYSETKNWLYLIDSPTGRGKAGDEQQKSLAQTVQNSRYGVVFVSALRNIGSFKRHLGRISRNTTVWLAAEPGHMIHWGGPELLEART